MSAKEPGKSGGKKSASKLGHDPLAWIDAADEQTVAATITKTAPLVQPVNENAAQSPAQLILPEYCGISQAGALCEEMRKLTNAGHKTIEIIGGNVETMDASVVQLLMALNKEAADKAIRLEWLSTSAKINDTSRLLGISPSLGIKT